MGKITLSDTDKYVRDSHSKALISTDYAARTAYKLKKAESEKLISYGSDINKLKDEMCEIKNLLEQILINQGRGT